MMQLTEYSVCFIKATQDKLVGIMGTYIDDIVLAQDSKLESSDKITQERFQSKPREYDKFTYAGIKITNEGPD